MKFSERIASLGYATYADYLRSPHWKSVRLAYRSSGRPRRCYGCDSPKYALHHLTYERLGREEVGDFLPLCPACHRLVHDNERAFPGLGLPHGARILARVLGWSREQFLERVMLFRPTQLAKAKGKAKRRKKRKAAPNSPKTKRPKNGPNKSKKGKNKPPERLYPDGQGWGRGERRKAAVAAATAARREKYGDRIVMPPQPTFARKKDGTPVVGSVGIPRARRSK